MALDVQLQLSRTDGSRRPFRTCLAAASATNCDMSSTCPRLDVQGCRWTSSSNRPDATCPAAASPTNQRQTIHRPRLRPGGAGGRDLAREARVADDQLAVRAQRAAAALPVEV